MSIIALSRQVSSCSTVPWCIIVDSVCLHGHRAALRKAYFVHIAVSLRHGKAYGKYSYAFPGVSDSVCVCVCVSCFICAFLRTWTFELKYIWWNLRSVSQLSGYFLVNIHCAKHVTQATTATDLSVYCTYKGHIPLLYSILVSPLTFMRKCDVVWFRLVLGLFNIVFLWGQTNSTLWEGCRAPLPASYLQ